MANLNIMVVSRGGEVCRISQNPSKGTTKKMVYEACVEPSIQGATRINCLSIIVETMRKLKEGKLEETKDIATIYTVGLVSDMVDHGTFKHWMNNGGKKLDGSAVNETELLLWGEFVTLYKELFMNLNFKNISAISIKDNARFRPTKEQIALSKLATMAWESVAEAEPVVEENADGL